MWITPGGVVGADGIPQGFTFDDAAAFPGVNPTKPGVIIAVLKSADKLRQELGLPDPRELVPAELREFSGDVYSQAELLLQYLEDYTGLPFAQAGRAVTPEGVAQIPGLDGLLVWFAEKRNGIIVMVPKWRVDP